MSWSFILLMPSTVTCTPSQPKESPEAIRMTEQLVWQLERCLVAQIVKCLPTMWETGFDPWVGKIPWRREWLPIPVFWPREFLGLYSLWGYKELDMTEQLSLSPSNAKWSGAKANRVLSRECTGHSKHPFPIIQGMTLYMDITQWSILKSDWLYSLQPKMDRLYTVNKNKTWSWLCLISWTPYCKIQI